MILSLVHQDFDKIKLVQNTFDNATFDVCTHVEIVTMFVCWRKQLNVTFCGGHSALCDKMSSRFQYRVSQRKITRFSIAAAIQVE